MRVEEELGRRGRKGRGEDMKGGERWGWEKRGRSVTLWAGYRQHRGSGGNSLGETLLVHNSPDYWVLLGHPGRPCVRRILGSCSNVDSEITSLMGLPFCSQHTCRDRGLRVIQSCPCTGWENGTAGQPQSPFLILHGHLGNT